MSRPALAVLLVAGLSRRPGRDYPNIQSFGLYEDITALGVPCLVYDLPTDRPAATRLQEGTFAEQVVPLFWRWYREQTKQLGPACRLILVGYSAGGFLLYSWCAEKNWNENARIAHVVTLAAPHSFRKGAYYFELFDGRRVDRPFGVQEPDAPIGIVVERLQTRLEVFYGENDMTIEREDARIPGHPEELQHSVVGARHLTIGDDAMVRSRIVAMIKNQLHRDADTPLP